MDQVENFKNISKDFQIMFCYETLKTPLIGKEGSKTSTMVRANGELRVLRISTKSENRLSLSGQLL